jgi:ribosomal protein S12 methylthiotransferase accessory factor
VSAYAGIVSATTDLLHSPDDPLLFHVIAVAANTEQIVGRAGPKFSGGNGSSKGYAVAAAIGEAAERYAAVCYPEETLALRSAAELGTKSVAPESFALFSRAQYAKPSFPYAAFGRDTRLRWAWASDLVTGEARLIPAQLTYMGCGPDEERIAYSTSSGAACGPTFEEAVLSALLELVERDSFLLMWYNRLSLPRIDLSADPLLVEEHRQFYAPTRLDYTVVSMYDLLKVPTALAIVRSPGNVALAVGAACATTMQTAVRKALREAFQTRAFARQLRLDRPNFDAGIDFANIHSFEDHVLHYAFEKNALKTFFMESSQVILPLDAIPPIPESTVTEAILEIARRLKAAGVAAFVADITPIDLRSVGLHVARVVSPELCRLDVDYRFLGGRRLYDAAFAAGLAPAPFDEAGLNPQPHPFP